MLPACSLLGAKHNCSSTWHSARQSPIKRGAVQISPLHSEASCRASRGAAGAHEAAGTQVLKLLLHGEWSEQKGSCIRTSCCKFTLENQNLVRHCLQGTFTRHVEVKFTPPSFQQLWWKPSANVILGVDVASAAVRPVLRNGCVKLSAQMPDMHRRTLILNNQGSKLKQIMSARSILLLGWSLYKHWLIILYSWSKRHVTMTGDWGWLSHLPPVFHEVVHMRVEKAQQCGAPVFCSDLTIPISFTQETAV